ncbi:MAG TPA: cytosine permease [Herpetosiphonaceae bacterium]
MVDSVPSEPTHPANTTLKARLSDLLIVEQHGLDPIPADQRYGQPRALFWTWLGGAYNYVTLAAGALLILLGLSLWQALLAVVLGNILGAIVFGLCALPGPITATATIVNTRAAFGHKGNLFAAAISFVSVSGWVAVNSVFAAFALFQVLQVAGISPGTTLKAILVAVVLVVQMIIAIVGHALVMALERVFAVGVSIVLTGLLVVILPRVNWAYPAAATLADSSVLGTWLLAVSLMFAGPLAWTNYAADYARYLPRQTKGTRVAFYSALGMGAANILGCSIGALLATLVDMNDPLANVPHLLPVWYILIFLAAVLIGAVANNVMNLYTAGLGLLALRVHAPRWIAVLVIGVIASMMTYIAVFMVDFMTFYAQLLLLSLCFLAPWAAILIVDYWLRGGRYHIRGLHTWGSGPYWFRNGVNRSAVVVYLAGIIASFAFSNSTLWASPLVIAYLGGADLSLFVGMVLTGTLYYVTERRTIGSARSAVRAAEDEHVNVSR